MRERCNKFAVPALLIVALGIAVWVNAGDLNPPPGPVSPTMKTLDEVEPRMPVSMFGLTISSPGSYYLVNNLDVDACGGHGIEIDADDVTLDLNGFTLSHSLNCSLDGIHVVGTHRNITIRNGTVRGFTGDGVNLSTAQNCQVSDLKLYDNGQGGGGAGLRSGDGSTVVRCTARENGGFGIHAGAGSTVRDCAARVNGTDGIFVDNGSTVQNCSAFQNSGNGIFTDNGSTVVGCAAGDNTGRGIQTRSGCTVRNCTAYSNDDDGFALDVGCTISACTAWSNRGNGILAAGDCRIIGNTCDSNGIPDPGDVGAGIYITDVPAAGSNRIEGNNVTDNDCGIDVNASGNIIIKNTASGNTTNYDILAGNTVGEILNFAGGGTITSHNPWANFEY